MNHQFHPQALEDYLEASLYYAERDPILALRFVEAVEDTIRRVLEAPKRWRILDDEIRRCLVHVFPYGILYTIESDFILIVAVMHGGREPGYWKQRVPKRRLT